MTEQENMPASSQVDETPVNPQDQVSERTSTDPQAGTSPNTSQKAARSADDYERMLSELRKENASHRTRLKKFEDEERARTEAQLSEQQKLEKRLADLQTQHDQVLRQSQERLVNAEVRLTATQLGIIDPDAAVRLLDWSALEYDEQGNPKNVDVLLKTLLKAKPYLSGGSKQPGASAGGATNPGRGQGTGELSWAAISRMTPAEYQARGPEIRQWIAQHPNPRRQP